MNITKKQLEKKYNIELTRDFGMSGRKYWVAHNLDGKFLFEAWTLSETLSKLEGLDNE